MHRVPLNKRTLERTKTTWCVQPKTKKEEEFVHFVQQMSRVNFIYIVPNYKRTYLWACI